MLWCRPFLVLAIVSFAVEKTDTRHLPTVDGDGDIKLPTASAVAKTKRKVSHAKDRQLAGRPKKSTTTSKFGATFMETEEEEDVDENNDNVDELNNREGELEPELGAGDDDRGGSDDHTDDNSITGKTPTGTDKDDNDVGDPHVPPKRRKRVMKLREERRHRATEGVQKPLTKPLPAASRPQHASSDAAQHLHPRLKRQFDDDSEGGDDDDDDSDEYDDDTEDDDGDDSRKKRTARKPDEHRLEESKEAAEGTSEGSGFRRNSADIESRSPEYPSSLEERLTYPRLKRQLDDGDDTPADDDDGDDGDDDDSDDDDGGKTILGTASTEVDDNNVNDPGFPKIRRKRAAKRPSEVTSKHASGGPSRTKSGDSQYLELDAKIQMNGDDDNDTEGDDDSDDGGGGAETDPFWQEMERASEIGTENDDGGGDADDDDKDSDSATDVKQKMEVSAEVLSRRRRESDVHPADRTKASPSSDKAGSQPVVPRARRTPDDDDDDDGAGDDDDDADGDDDGADDAGDDDKEEADDDFMDAFDSLRRKRDTRSPVLFKRNSGRDVQFGKRIPRALASGGEDIFLPQPTLMRTARDADVDSGVMIGGGVDIDLDGLDVEITGGTIYDKLEPVPSSEEEATKEKLETDQLVKTLSRVKLANKDKDSDQSTDDHQMPGGDDDHQEALNTGDDGVGDGYSRRRRKRNVRLTYPRSRKEPDSVTTKTITEVSSPASFSPQRKSGLHAEVSNGSYSQLEIFSITSDSEHTKHGLPFIHADPGQSAADKSDDKTDDGSGEGDDISVHSGVDVPEEKVSVGKRRQSLYVEQMSVNGLSSRTRDGNQSDTTYFLKTPATHTYTGVNTPDMPTQKRRQVNIKHPKYYDNKKRTHSVVQVDRSGGAWNKNKPGKRVTNVRIKNSKRNERRDRNMKLIVNKQSSQKNVNNENNSSNMTHDNTAETSMKNVIRLTKRFEDWRGYNGKGPKISEIKTAGENTNHSKGDGGEHTKSVKGKRNENRGDNKSLTHTSSRKHYKQKPSREKHKRRHKRGVVVQANDEDEDEDSGQDIEIKREEDINGEGVVKIKGKKKKNNAPEVEIVNENDDDDLEGVPIENDEEVEIVQQDEQKKKQAASKEHDRKFKINVGSKENEHPKKKIKIRPAKKDKDMEVDIGKGKDIQIKKPVKKKPKPAPKIKIKSSDNEYDDVTDDDTNINIVASDDRKKRNTRHPHNEIVDSDSDSDSDCNSDCDSDVERSKRSDDGGEGDDDDDDGSDGDGGDDDDKNADDDDHKLVKIRKKIHDDNGIQETEETIEVDKSVSDADE